MTKAFINHRDNGVHLQFPNGNSISTIWGWGSYSEGRDFNDGTEPFTKRFDRNPDGSNTVEIMISCPDKLHESIYKKYDSDDSVIGYVSMDDWMKIINRLWRAPPRDRVDND